MSLVSRLVFFDRFGRHVKEHWFLRKKNLSRKFRKLKLQSQTEANEIIKKKLAVNELIAEKRVSSGSFVVRDKMKKVGSRNRSSSV